MKIKTEKLPWRLDPRLVSILEQDLNRTGIVDDLILSYRDSDYTPEGGGFHPVEFAFRKDGTLLHATDFCYAGRPPMCDLCKSLDFDFSLDIFRNFSHEYPIDEGKEIFKIFESNFISYHSMDVYTVTVTPW